ncbi:hypothetical protein OG21DRAFT_1144306 [Imleria badia]|nr:hypothetical protein OG21DRAFT_1144306 [Imleria badia]
MADLHSIPNEFIRALSDFPTNDMPRTSGSFSSVTHTHPTALLSACSVNSSPASTLPPSPYPHPSAHPADAQAPSHASLCSQMTCTPLAFSISDNGSVKTVTPSPLALFDSPHPPKMRQECIYRTAALPCVPPIPAHLASSSSASTSTSRCDDDTAGLVRPRLEMAVGSQIGGRDFQAAKRAKREGRAPNGMEELGSWFR